MAEPAPDPAADLGIADLMRLSVSLGCRQTEILEVASISLSVLEELPEDLRASVVMEELSRVDLSSLRGCAEKPEKPLWEWCRWIGVSECQSWKLPADAWGVYSAEQNSTVEQAFQARQRAVRINLGIREYEVVFGSDPNFALQEDPKLRKRRLVRRRLVTRAEYELAIAPPPPETPRGQDTCALCAEDFAETTAMPTRVLPVCFHVFHQACLQELADDGHPCPVCRREIDWSALLRE